MFNVEANNSQLTYLKPYIIIKACPCWYIHDLLNDAKILLCETIVVFNRFVFPLYTSFKDIG